MASLVLLEEIGDFNDENGNGEAQLCKLKIRDGKLCDIMLLPILLILWFIIMINNRTPRQDTDEKQLFVFMDRLIFGLL